MQNIYTPPFEERMTYYASKMVAEQGKAGWNYDLEPVFAVAVMDFNFSHLSPKLVRDIMLTDRVTGEVLRVLSFNFIVISFKFIVDSTIAIPRAGR